MNFLYASRIESLFAWTLWYTLVVTWHWTVTYFVTWLGLPNPVDYINYGLYCRMSTEKTTCQLLSNPYTTLFSKPEAWLVNENFRRESKRTRLGEGAWSIYGDISITVTDMTLKFHNFCQHGQKNCRKNIG